MKRIIGLIFLILYIFVFLVACMTAPGDAAPNYNLQDPSNHYSPTPYGSFRFEWNEEYNGYFVYESDSNIYTSIVIPQAYQGSLVVGIGEFAFGSYSNVQNVIIPDTVKVIESNAFNYCDYLENIVFNGKSSLLEIKENAFFNCKTLTQITVPASVELIGLNAFSTCPSLERINVDVNNKNYCAVNGVLYSKDMKTLIAVPPAFPSVNFEILNGIVNIANCAFFNSDSIATITIPATVKNIGDNVFGEYLKEINYEGSCSEWMNLIRDDSYNSSVPSEPGGEVAPENPDINDENCCVVNCNDGTVKMER